MLGVQRGRHGLRESHGDGVNEGGSMGKVSILERIESGERERLIPVTTAQQSGNLNFSSAQLGKGQAGSADK